MEDKKKKRGKLPWVIIIGIVALGVFYWNYSRGQAAAEHKYTLYTLRQREPLVLKGTSQVVESVAVSMDPSKGEVQQILVKTGDTVREGEVLFSYSSTQLEDRVEDAARLVERSAESLASAEEDLSEAEANQKADKASLSSARSSLDASREALRKAEKNLEEAQAEMDLDAIEKQTERMRNETDDVQEFSQDVARYEAKVDSWPAQIDQMKKIINQAENALEDARIQLDRAESSPESTETADISGIVRVTERNRRDPQGALIEIVSEETLIKATVTEYDHFRLHPGDAVKVRVVSTQEELPGAILTVEPLPQSSQGVPGQVMTVSSVNYSFEVKPQGSVHPGYSVEIHVPLNEVVIPGSAVVTEGEKTSVWLYSEGSVKKMPVALVRSGAYMILEEGLKEGDVIIQDPDQALLEGGEVRTIQP